MKLAIVGSGISGLAVAHRLHTSHEITLFEANDYFGGHAHTVDVTLPSAQGLVSHGVDTGFLVLNERTYPRLIALLQTLGVEMAPSDMSFSVQTPLPGQASRLEWSGSDLRSLFAQRRNLVRPAFWGMLADLLRFNRLCTQIATAQDEDQLRLPLQTFLDQHRFGQPFRDWYFLPMLGCIWSCPTDQMLQFPVATMIRFCHNHGLLQITRRPQWYTVDGGSREYVGRIVSHLADARLQCPVRRISRDAAGVTVHTDHGSERFDAVVLATHSDQALALLEQPSPLESQLLGQIRYQPNRAVLHTDTAVMPTSRAAWAAWNYERASDARQESAQVCLHYWLNRLQLLPFSQAVMVSLNPVRTIRPECVLGEYDYSHPVFDLAAIEAQRQIPRLQGVQHTWYCGAWTGYGFHEDGLSSGLEVADQLQQLGQSPWARVA